MVVMETKSAPKVRYWPVDTLRGVAIVLMVIYHFTWDLAYTGVYGGNMLATPWQMFARFIATLFIFVMGVSFTLSYHRAGAKSPGRNLFPKYFWRGAKVLGLGLVVSVGTYFFVGENGFVVFGILHLIGLSIVAAYPFLRFKWISLVVGGGVILAGVYANTIIVAAPWLIWLGIRQAGRYMVDYYPFLPWFGVALMGIFAGHTFYPAGSPRFTWPDFSAAKIVRGLSFLGQHSLLIYMLHQPILLGLLYLALYLF